MRFKGAWSLFRGPIHLACPWPTPAPQALIPYPHSPYALQEPRTPHSSCLYGTSNTPSPRGNIFRAMSQRCQGDIRPTGKLVSHRKYTLGKPSRFKVGMVRQIQEYFLLNSNPSIDQIAEYLGISPTALRRYAERFRSVGDAIRKGGVPFDVNAAKSLYERVLGYEYVEKKVVILQKKKSSVEIDDTGEVIETQEIIEFHKHLPGSVEAQKYWLSKRNENWREKDEVEKFEKDKELIAELLQVNQEDLPE